MSRGAERPDRADWTEDRRGPVAGFSTTVPRLALGTRRVGFSGRQMLLQRRDALLQHRPSPREWRRSALLIRLVQVAAGLAVLLLAPHPPLVLVLVLLLGLLAAVLSPSRTGQAMALAAGIACWVSGYGAHGTPAVARVLAFAFALFLLHDSTSLAAAVPITAELRREAVLGWLRRDAVALLAAGVLAGVVYGFGALVDFRTSYPLMLAGLLGIAAALAAAAWLFSRSLR